MQCFPHLTFSSNTAMWKSLCRRAWRACASLVSISISLFVRTESSSRSLRWPSPPPPLLRLLITPDTPADLSVTGQERVSLESGNGDSYGQCLRQVRNVSITEVNDSNKSGTCHAELRMSGTIQKLINNYKCVIEHGFQFD